VTVATASCAGMAVNAKGALLGQSAKRLSTDHLGAMAKRNNTPTTQQTPALGLGAGCIVSTETVDRQAESDPLGTLRAIMATGSTLPEAIDFMAGLGLDFARSGMLAFMEDFRNTHGQFRWDGGEFNKISRSLRWPFHCK